MRFLEAEFQVCEVVNTKTQNANYILRFDGRIRRRFTDIPENLWIHAIRGADDDGCDCSIEKGVMVNHNSDVILHPKLSKELLEVIEKDGLAPIYFDTEKDEPDEFELNFLDFYMTYEDFMEATQESMIQERILCPYCKHIFLADEQQYSYDRNGEISSPTNLDDTTAEMVDGDELCGPYCPECLGCLS